MRVCASSKCGLSSVTIDLAIFQQSLPFFFVIQFETEGDVSNNKKPIHPVCFVEYFANFAHFMWEVGNMKVMQMLA